jgi:N-glycosylase/DNA lyase
MIVPIRTGMTTTLPSRKFEAASAGDPLSPLDVVLAVTPVLFPLEPEEPLSLEHTLGCGQVFRWRLRGEYWYGPYREGSLAVRRVVGGVEVRALDVAVTCAEAWAALGLHVSLAEIERLLAWDGPVREAFRVVRGLRVMRQDPWECLAGFICSQNSNVPKIELSLERISRAWGVAHRWPEGVEGWSLPSAQMLAAAGAEELRATGLGYRCPYLAAAAGLVAAGEVDLHALRELPYEEALGALLRLPGVGRKVADCILLFALDKPEAMPVDVWVRRAVHELYPRELAEYLPDAASRRGKTLSAIEHAAILRFARDRWGPLAGYAQQYLFHARRRGLVRW